MRFYHGTSVRGWLGILKSGSMDSKKIGDSRVSALYSKFKGNYLTTNRKIAEMYASKAGKGVVIEIDYDPLAPGRVNNFKEQQAAGKDYFVEETPLQVDGPDCTIDTKDPLMSKAKMCGDINKTTEEIHMSENTERDLRNAWQKLEEALLGVPQGATQISHKPGQGLPPPPLKPGERDKLKAASDLHAKRTAGLPPAEQQDATMCEGGDIDRNKIESIYEFGGQILDSAEAQGLSLDETQIDVANQRIVSALQGEGMRNPHNLDAIIDDAVADAAYQGGDHADGVGGGIMESINRSLELVKQLKK